MYKTPISGEEKSAGATLSDMEIFIFPELMFSLVLANILSPRLGGGCAALMDGERAVCAFPSVKRPREPRGVIKLSNT